MGGRKKQAASRVTRSIAREDLSVQPELNSTPMPEHQEFTIPEDQSVIQNDVTIKAAMSVAPQTSEIKHLAESLDRIVEMFAKQQVSLQQHLAEVNARMDKGDRELEEFKSEIREEKKTLTFAEPSNSIDASQIDKEEQPQPPSQPVTDNELFTSNQSHHYAPISRKLYDLPIFSGNPEEWPMFYHLFRETTKTYQYSNLQNLIRLQKSVQGRARAEVEPMLIHPNNIEEIMKELEFRFGRTDLLTKSQIAMIRNIPKLEADNFTQLIEYSTKIRNFVIFMKGANAEYHLQNPLLVEELVAKLPSARKMEWAYQWSNVGDDVSVVLFADWLSHVARAASLVESSGHSYTSQCGGELSKTVQKKKRFTLHTAESTNTKSERRLKCNYCASSHTIIECKKFLNENVQSRWNWVKQKNVCFSCLNIGHRVVDCRKKDRCDVQGCAKRHHTLLHEDQATAPVEAPTTTNNTTAAGVVLNVHQADDHVYFKVVAVTVVGANGKSVNTFAVIDDASSMTFMESSLASELDLKPSDNEVVELSWLDNTTNKCRTPIVNCQIKGRNARDSLMPLNKIRLLDHLSLPYQTIKIDEIKNKHPQLAGLPIRGYKNAKPRILIGLNNARLACPMSVVDCPPAGPIAIETPLGWVVYGPDNSKFASQVNRHILFINESQREQYESLSQTVASYYDLENFGIVKPTEQLCSNEEKRAQNILETTTKNINGKYETGLLWKTDQVVMPNNYKMTLRRLHNLEKKMNQDAEYAEQYRQAMTLFLSKNYASKLSSTEVNVINERTWYLPHFGVRNPNKPGKLRIVFDAAATIGKTSLNSQLLKGPNLNQSLVAVLSQFREGAIAVCADIKEMFCQVSIRKEDRNSQRFLWRDGKEVQVYEMKSMIFGATCSPVSAQFVKNTNANQFREQFPAAVEAIIRNHYVDDFVMSFQCEDTAISVSKQIVHIHKAAGFELRGFVSNSRNLVNALNQEETSQNILTNLNAEPVVNTDKILGMYWRSSSDEFVFEFKFHKVPSEVLQQLRNPTKREMLSLAMSIFDPFGLITNFHISAKILIQMTWKLPIDWDEEVPDNISQMWYQWQLGLELIKNIRVPRCYSINLPNAVDIQLHIFVDASEVAFAAVAYWRIKYDSKVEVVFICGKARVAPSKPMSIPRMELQAAVLGVRMKQSILENHTLTPSKCKFWSDSKTVVHWIKSHKSEYKPFVAHRIFEILENSDESEWNWLPTNLNTADEATRLKLPIQDPLESRWLLVPEFLLEDDSCWPVTPDVSHNEDISEVRKAAKVLVIAEKFDEVMPDITRFSKFNRLIRTFAYVRRAVFNWTEKLKGHESQFGALTSEELEAAEMMLCITIQRTTFVNEYCQLEKGKSVNENSEIFQLSPYMHDKVIRLNGRIEAANIVPFNTRKPIILPKKHKFTYLLVAKYHEEMKHANDETVICQIRAKYWIPSVRVVLKTVKSQCQYCKIKRAAPQQPMMGQLPFDRVAGFVRPFAYTGLDYFGPFNIVVGRSNVKRWVAIFTCSTYKAVHVEVAFDLSTDACILCLRNFFNIRGIPKRMRSDNGTNFIGLKGELCNVSDFFDTERIISKTAPFGIEWMFNCPADPSAGGSWERLVQSVKRALTSIMQNRSLREHTFKSFLLEATNIVNSRPLTHVPISPHDEEPLTPNHFLIGEMNSTQTVGATTEKLMCTRKQWRIAQQMKNHFYKRWIAEYLPTLTRRTKWFKNVAPLEPGQLVLLCETGLSRGQWPMGKVVEVTKAKDGQVRQAVIKTATGLLRRPANKIAVLDIWRTPAEIHGGGNVGNTALRH